MDMIRSVHHRPTFKWVEVKKATLIRGYNGYDSNATINPDIFPSRTLRLFHLFCCVYLTMMVHLLGRGWCPGIQVKYDLRNPH
jgi:hypothetical protein